MSHNPKAASSSTSQSHRTWLNDLAVLRKDAPFADVVWTQTGGHDHGERLVKAHKCIVYARATGLFQQRYLGVPHSISSESDLSLFGRNSTASFRTYTPSTASHNGSLTPIPHDGDDGYRLHSSTSGAVSGDAVVPYLRPLSLGSTDVGVFEAALDYFYTAAKEAEAFAMVLDGFKDRLQEEGDEGDDAVGKLRQDLLYCWRSKLYADVSLVLEGSETGSFAAHRAILVARSPYFRSLLLGNYSDSNQTTFTLPSPPFTPASTTFVLGYIYSGTLEFSSRKFDLSTAFEIWRCAAFLTMSQLQLEVEDRITSMLSLSRAARIFSFAHAPDVANSRLAQAASPFIVNNLDDVWAGPPVGLLPYEVQKQLVRQVCTTVKPATVADVARKVSSLRKRIETERAVWADHIRSMLEAIEEELVTVLAGGLPAVIASTGFVDLIDGVGFSTDVLEWLLALVVKGLTESKAAESYQALVGSVLLREEGMLADARLLVEDAKNGILKYVKRKWINIRAAGGFDSLQNWCLKELADELEISTEDLVADGPRLRTSPARSRQPPRRLVEGTPSIVVRARPSDVFPSKVAAKPSQPAPFPLPTPPTSATSRPPRLSTASTASRAVVLSTSSSIAPSLNGTAAPRTAGAPAPTTAARRAMPTRAPPAPATQPPPTSNRPSNSTTTARPGAPRLSAVLPSPSTSNNSTPPVPSALSVRPSRPPSTTSTSRPLRSTSPSPSVASRRSIASSMTARTVTRPGVSAAPLRATTPAATRSAVTRPASASSVAGPSTAASRLRKQSSSGSIRSTLSTASGAAPSLRRPPSSSSLAPRRPSSVASTKRPPSVVSTRRASTSTPREPSSTRPPPLPTSTSKRSLRSVATASGSRARPPLPSSSGAKASAALPGTSLLAGIPCIVTVKTTKMLRIKAMVRYIGQVIGDTGQWVGVEALESAIPPEAADLAWGNGTRNGVTYFKLSSPLPSPAAPSPTPVTSPPASSPNPPTTSSNSSSDKSSLRPPSTRPSARRSPTNGPTSNGPRKALFVRPDQILYVM